MVYAIRPQQLRCSCVGCGIIWRTAIGKPTLEIDRKRLRNALALAEKNGPLGSHHELFRAVADAYNAGDDPPPVEITWAIARSRCLEWGLPIKTPLGRKGRPKGRKDARKRRPPHTLPVPPVSMEAALRACLDYLTGAAAEEGWTEGHAGLDAIRAAQSALGDDARVRAGA